MKYFKYLRQRRFSIHFFLPYSVFISVYDTYCERIHRLTAAAIATISIIIMCRKSAMVVVINLFTRFLSPVVRNWFLLINLNNFETRVHHYDNTYVWYGHERVDDECAHV